MPPRVESSLRPPVRVGSGRVAWLYSAFPCFSSSFSSVACRAAISAAAVLVSCRSSLSLPPQNRGRFRFWKTPLLPSSLIPTVVPCPRRSIRGLQLAQLVILWGNNCPMVASEYTMDSKDHIPEEAKKMLQSLASEWDDVLDSNALQVIRLKGAMTNQVFQIKWPARKDGVPRKVLVRIYGEGVDVFFDRENEIRTFEFMSKHGQGPRLLGRFSNGRIEEFIHARTLSAPDLRDSEISAHIAAKMREFHTLDMPGPKNAVLWDRLRKWLQAAKDMATSEEAKAVNLDAIEDEIVLLQRELAGKEHIGFCHNDLQYGNIMMEEDTKAITIIDYEYSSYNPIAFDIANHFCEMTADYHTETPHILDFGKYPGLEERRRFIRIYLSHSGHVPSEAEVEQLVQDVEKYTLASHLFWGLWGIISEHVNEIDFDYIGYARQRFERYWSTRPILLSSHGTSASDGATDS